MKTITKDSLLEQIKTKALKGEGITYEEGLEIAKFSDSDIFKLIAVTDEVRTHFKGTEVNMCSIVNAKSGLCKEDCSFCSQSVHFDTGVKEYKMMDSSDIAQAAIDAEKAGSNEFSIVTSGTTVTKDKDIAVLKDALSQIKDNTELERCASLGIMKEKDLKELKDAGLESFHHNLETSRSYFPQVCTTHSYDDDYNTVKRAKDLGFYVCSGGIMGLGEGWEHRVELAQTLKELNVDSIPINFLNPRPGTPLENAEELTPMDCLKIIAIFRLTLPTKDILVCGGRELNLRELQPLMFSAGANGTMLGNYLTTKGRASETDLQMIKDLGLTVRKGH